MWALPPPDPAHCGLCGGPGVCGVFPGEEFGCVTWWCDGDIVLTCACHPPAGRTGGVAIGRSLVAGPRPVCAACGHFIAAADSDGLVRSVAARLLRTNAERWPDALLPEPPDGMLRRFVPSVEAAVRLVLAHRRSPVRDASEAGGRA
jgi:hypothetical protein